ncbi:hypothetical protein H0H93_004573, partial [Arthromyces matolae]
MPSSDPNTKLRPFPPDLQQDFNRAQREPKKYFFPFTMMIIKRPDYKVISTHPAFISLYASQLSTNLPDTPPRDENEFLYSNVPGAFVGISQAISLNEIVAGPAFERALMSVWTSQVWPWIRLVYSVVTHMDCEDDDDNINDMAMSHDQAILMVFVSIEHILWFLLRCSNLPRTSSTICETRGVVGLLMEMYLNMGRLPSEPKIYFRRANFICEIIEKLESSPSSQVAEIFEALPIGVHRNPSAIAFFTPLVFLISRDLEWLTCLVKVLDIQLLLISWHPALYARLPTELVMHQIRDILAKSISLRNHEDPSYSRGLFTRGMAFLNSYATKSAQDESWVIHALRLDILSLTKTSATMLYDWDNDDEGSHEPDLYLAVHAAPFKLIAPYLMYRSVLRRVLKYAELGDALESTSKDFREGWKLFSKKLGYARDAHDAFERKKPFSPRCDYSSCQVQPGEVQLRRSRDFLLSPRFTAFAKFVVKHQMRDQRALIVEKRDEFLVKIGYRLDLLHPLVFLMDYSRGGTEFDVLEDKRLFEDYFDFKFPVSK